MSSDTTSDHAALIKVESMGERADLAVRLRPFVSKRWLMTNVFDFTEEQVIEIEMQRRHEATKIPQDVQIGWKIDDLNVGPNDVLVIYVDVAKCSADQAEKYLRSVKESLKPVWERAGLSDRLLCVASNRTGFSVIHIAEVGMTLAKEGAEETRRMLRARIRKFQPPIMG